MIPRFIKPIAITFLLLVGGMSAYAQTTADVIVYGSTPGGYCAAIAAAREGASVILLEPTQHVGGMNTGGLSFSDSNQMYRDKLMGLFHEWHLRIQQDYTDRGITLPYDVNIKNQTDWSYEPHVASRVTNAMLAEAGVTVLTERYLQSVTMTGPRITSVVTGNGTYTGRVFIDGSYEGDLMAAAGVSWTIGREGTADFNESLAGKVYPKSTMNISGLDAQGDPLPLVTTTDGGPTADGDDNIMTYSFRLSLTNDPGNRVTMPAPANYDPARFEVMRRYVAAGGNSIGFDRYDVPGGKKDGNNSIGRQFSLGFVGGAKGWATADEAGRAAIFEEHKQYTLEFLYFLSNDPVFSASQRASNAQWGLCADEFTAFGNFPPQLYVRESRRMQGMYVITENDIIGDPVKTDPIMVSSFPIDSHDCQRIAYPDGGVRNEGTIFPVREPGGIRRGYPYHVPYRSILPQPGECDNLLVPVALSCTHVAISSLRIEATWMLIGQSAGIAAALAADQDVTVQALPYEDLETRMLAQGQVLTLPEAYQPLEGIVLDDPDAELAGTWNTSTTISPFIGDGYRFTGTAGTPNDGSAVATFRFTAPEAGIYTLNMAYSPDPTRATNVPVTVTSGPHVTNFSVDQTEARPPGATVREIGTAELVAGEESVITIGSAGTTGFVILDAIQLVLDEAPVGWTPPGASGVTADSALIAATLLGSEAEVSLYWKAGSSAPEQHTGWDGSLTDPGVNVSPGLVERTITGLQADTLYSCIYHANNTTIPAEAWSTPLSFATALGAAQVPVITAVVADAGSVTLSWQDNANTETAYLVQRATEPGGPYTTIATLAPDTTTYVDNALPGAGTFHYRVAASNSDNGSTTDPTAAQTSAEVAATTSFQEGVSPTSGYAHDAVMIRSRGDNGAADTNQDGNALFVGLAESGSEILRGLLEFDLSSIPSGDAIQSVSLHMTTLASSAGINNVGGPGALTTFDLHTHPFDIDETTATWNTPGGGAPAGGTLGTLLSSTSLDVEGLGQEATFADTPEFRNAVENALAGDGILRLILANTDESNLGTHDFARFESDDSATPAARPELRITIGSSSFVITSFSHSSATDEVTLSWSSRPGESYRVAWSSDLSDWTGTLASDVEADPGTTTTRIFDLDAAGLAAEPQVFFRVEK